MIGVCSTSEQVTVVVNTWYFSFEKKFTAGWYGTNVSELMIVSLAASDSRDERHDGWNDHNQVKKAHKYI